MLQKKKRERVRIQTPRKRVRKSIRRDYRNVFERNILREFGHIITPPSTKLAIRWNYTAAECYNRLLKCEGCQLREFCEQGNYSMRGVVRELIRTLTLKGIETALTEGEIKTLDEFRMSAIIE